jgi:ABC-type phosphate/phosphonate transport system substrate-binding protein
MIATLPMYDWPEVAEATDTFWRALAQRLGVNHPLDRSIDYRDSWRRPDLVFSQTCGFPLSHEFRGILDYVATPHYAAEGCSGPNYSSFIFARENQPLEAFRNTTAAINTPDSMSGMLALKLVFQPLARERRFFGKAIMTGGHVNSLVAVRDGKADICAIDAVMVGLARRHRPELLQGLVPVANSPLVPSLPFVTRAGDPIKLRAALADVFLDPAFTNARNILLLNGFSILDTSAYDIIAAHETRMQGHGGITLPTPG